MKLLLLVIVGVAIGYFIGFSDARRHEKNVLQRTVDRFGTTAAGRNAKVDSLRDSLAAP
jgi:hypothetical protein